MSEKQALFVYGASGHAKVVIDIAEKMGEWVIRGVLDDKPELTGRTFMGYPVLGRGQLIQHLNPGHNIVVAIGDNVIRHRIGQDLLQRGFALPVLIHPSAVIGRDVMIGAGTVVMASVVINPATTVAAFCILNTACTVDHDNVLGQAVHISPGAHLAGEVTIGDESWIGIGASVIQQRKIGSRCMIGAGAVVIEDVDDNHVVVGVPGRSIGLNTIAPLPSPTVA